MIESGGCCHSDVGTTDETDGRSPFAAASKNSVFGRMSLNCFVTWTVLNPGSGFTTGFVLSSDGLLHGGRFNCPCRREAKLPRSAQNQVMSADTYGRGARGPHPEAAAVGGV